MAIDPHYIPAFSIEDVILDKDTGAPLSGGLVYFEQDNQRGTLKPVYQITGTSPNYSYIQLPNPMTLSSIGTFEDSLGNPVIPYFFPYDANFDPEYYFVRVTSSTDIPQFTREAVPYIPISGDNAVSSAFTNELSNPQFAEVFFDSPHTYNFNAVTDNVVAIAPGWDIVVTSPAAGTVTVSIITPTGSLNRLTNPGTILNINSTGLTSLRLRQRLYGSPNLWGSDYLSGTFVAKTYAGTSSTIDLLYSQSDGTVIDQVISSGILTADGLYAAYPGSVLLPQSDSTEFFPDSYVDIELDIPLSTEVDITSVMVSSTGGFSMDDIIYDQTTLDRQIDQLFHYYKPQLEYKPIPSYTLGWDFAFNPCQELGRTVGVSGLANNKSRYIADQTIAFEQVGGALTYTFSNNGGLIVSTSSPSQFAIIQYLGASDALELLQGDTLAVKLSAATSGTVLNGYVNIYYTTNTNLPSVIPGTNNSIVATLVSGQPATFNGTWTKLPRPSAGDALFPVPATSTYTEFSLTGWEPAGLAGITTATYIAIVVSFSLMPSTQTLGLRYCTLAKGSIATNPPPLNHAQTLQGLQDFYETNYPVGTAVGSANTFNLMVFPMGNSITTAAGAVTAYGVQANSFSIPFMANKRRVPTFTPISQAGTANNFSFTYRLNGVNTGPTDVSSSAFWSLGNTGAKGIYYQVSSSTPMFAASPPSGALTSFIGLNYIADARYGIVN